MKRRTLLFLIIGGVLLVTFFADRWRRANRESSQDKNILAASKKYGVDPALVKAVVWRESRFEPHARGSKEELGLMQIKPNTGREWAGAQRIALFSEFMLLDPAKNIDCGTWYLRKLLGRYQQTDNAIPYALSDYNAGRGNVLKWMKGGAVTNSSTFIGEIGFPSTREYVRAVMHRRKKYEKEFAIQPK